MFASSAGLKKRFVSKPRTSVIGNSQMQVRRINGVDYVLIRERRIGTVGFIYTLIDAIALSNVQGITETGEVNVFQPIHTTTFISFESSNKSNQEVS